MIEIAKLRFFPFSLKDKAKGWLYTLKSRRIGNWGEMTQEFYKKFFPPHKVQQVKRKISSFVQETMRHYSWLGIAKSNDIEKCPFLAPFSQALKLPKNLDVTSEILKHLHQVKVNLPLLHIIKPMPLYAKIINDLCTVKRKHHVKKTAFLTEQVSAIIQHKV